MDFPDLPRRLADVRARIAEAQARGGWSHPVTIVAVTKTLPPGAVRAAHAAGLADVGENRVQEALAKQDLIAEVPVRWHLVGGLQRNKARAVGGRFALIHTVDRVGLVDELERRLPAEARQPVLVQVNCSGEPQKGGVEPDELPALLGHLDGANRLEVRGLMTMAELTDDEGRQRATFRQLRALRDSARRPDRPLPELSMGMSGDYRMAVEEGATLVRLGTILFGERNA